MTKQELIDRVQIDIEAVTKRAIQKKEVRLALENAFCLIASKIIKEGRFAWPSFGSFVLHTRKSRTGRNPRTGEQLEINKRDVIVFRPSVEIQKKLGWENRYTMREFDEIERRQKET